MNYFQRYLSEEFAEDYQEGRISRREALKLIASVTGSALLANSILAACTPPSPAPPASQPVVQADFPPTPTNVPDSTATSSAPQPVYDRVSADDPAVTASMVQFPDTGVTLTGYLARPNRAGTFPMILVCHENRGLTPYIQDVARRLAKAGYAALAVDLLSRKGGSQALSANDIPGILGNTPPNQFVQDFKSGFRYLQSQSFAQADRAGMVGFCFGGGVTWQVAIHMPELQAVVPFYGPQPPADDVATVKAAVLAFYGGKDQRIDAGIPAIEAAMKKYNKVFEKMIYPDADHAFHNDTGPRYNPEAARDAWARTLAWFKRYVG